MDQFDLLGNALGTAVTGPSEVTPNPPQKSVDDISVPVRDGSLPVGRLIDLYMAQYAGRDMTRGTRLRWWQRELGAIALRDVSDDEIFAALERLGIGTSRYFAGRDADGISIYKSRGKPRSGATINRYSAAIGAVFTWAINRRIAPKGWVHPCRAVARQAESSGKTRFLSNEERARLLLACQTSHWAKLHMLVLMALTTGARRGELLGLRIRDLDLEHSAAYVQRSKNGDPKVLPLTAGVVALLTAVKGNPSSLVFGSYKNASKPYAVEACWQLALKVADIKNFRFHDLRHSCASMLAQNGATLLEIGDLLGHRQLQVTKRYSHLTAGHKLSLVTRGYGGSTVSNSMTSKTKKPKSASKPRLPNAQSEQKRASGVFARARLRSITLPKAIRSADYDSPDDAVRTRAVHRYLDLYLTDLWLKEEPYGEAVLESLALCFVKKVQVPERVLQDFMEHYWKFRTFEAATLDESFRVTRFSKSQIAAF